MQLQNFKIKILFIFIQNAYTDFGLIISTGIVFHKNAMYKKKEWQKALIV